MPLTVVRNDITKMMVDAVVNTASSLPRFGSGTDEAIYRAAGVEEMTAARLQIGEIAPGRSAATPAFRLEENGVRYVLHTVYSDWIRGDEAERRSLRDAYTSALTLARELGCSSVAVPLLGAGNRGYPVPVAIDEALAAICAFLHAYDMQVYLVLFSLLSIEEARRLFPDIPSFVDDAYVARRSPEPRRRRLFAPREQFPGAAASEERFAPPDGMRETPTAPESRAAAPEAELSLSAFEPESPDPRSEETLIRMFDRLSKERHLKIGDVYNKTSITRQVLSKARSNPEYHLGKKKVMELAILLQLSPDEASDFLSRADYAFNPASRFDRIVLRCMQRKIFDLFAIDEALYDAGETPFCEF